MNGPTETHAEPRRNRLCTVGCYWLHATINAPLRGSATLAGDTGRALLRKTVLGAAA